MKCLEDCRIKNLPCKQKDCRLWIDYKKDLNCIHEATKKNGPMTLRETAKRLNISFVRVKQIEDEAKRKLHRILKK
tara:strand:- start:433 stop:660 length:228 start_codon:yes stop_codon:yes gene_type:complete